MRDAGPSSRVGAACLEKEEQEKLPEGKEGHARQAGRGSCAGLVFRVAEGLLPHAVVLCEPQIPRLLIK